MLGRCFSGSCAQRPWTCAPQPFVSLPASARPAQQQQLRPCRGPQHRPATVAVVAAAGRGGSASRGGGGRSPSQRPGPPPAGGGISAKQLNSRISGCMDADVLMQLVKQHAASFDYIHASTALYRAANLMQPPLSADEQACVRQLVQLASVRLTDCGSQALANMTWALAKLEYNDKVFLQQLAQQSERILPHFKPQEVANALWAIAKLGHEDKAFTQRLLGHVRSCISGFTPQGVSNTLLAIAKLQHVAEDMKLAQNLLAHAQPQLSNFTEQQLANTAWALATLRHYDQEFVEQLLLQAKVKLSGFESQGISNTLWALAYLNHDDAAFVDDAIKRLLSLDPSDVNSQELRNSLWALSMLQHNAAAVVAPLVAAAAADFAAVKSSPGRINMKLLQLRQIHQYLVTMEGAGHVSRELQTSPQYQQLRGTCKATFHARADAVRSSPLRLIGSVLQAVKQLPGCATAQAAHLTADQDVKADLGVLLPCGTTVVVEVTPENACMVNAPDKPLGPLLWRRRQLAARGCKVVVVKEADWLEVGPEMQQMYLRMRFREAGVVLPAAGGAAAGAT